MPSNKLLKEAERVMVICNACRYCEGFCAVFPAMELRRTFSGQGLKYLANLCHNCRGCYYACQYAPPHEFDLNIPKVLAELRLKTYEEFAWPGFLGGLFRRNGLAASVITLLCVAIVLVLGLVLQGSSVVFSTHLGENAFYKVIPYPAMVLPISVLGIFILLILGKQIGNLCRNTGRKPAELVALKPTVRAIGDMLRLKYLDGAGHGCNYPDERFTMTRRYLHHLVFYGFMLCFASTTVAAFYDHILHWPSPYPFRSWPVALGIAGGFALLIGTGGLLYLKRLMDPAPATAQSLGMDVAFTVQLLLVSLTGLLLLALRETQAMGTLLLLHLGVVIALFITMPYGKFIHAVYRYAALVQNAIEQAQDKI